MRLSTWAREKRWADQHVDLYRHRLFGEAFAAYLRHNPARWRLRRSDSFFPQDINIAHRHMNIVGRIDRHLVGDFVALYGPELRIRKNAAEHVRDLTCLVPTFSHPKRLLLDPRQTLDGVPLASLHRYDDSRILARDLLGLLVDTQYPVSTASPRVIELHEIGRVLPLLRLLLSAVAFNDPHRLWERLRDWARANGADSHFVRDAGLADEKLLLDWIENEGKEFAPSLGAHLRRELQPAVEAYVSWLESRSNDAGAPFYIDPVLRPGALAVFPTFEALLLHAIQDVLKLTVETASPNERTRNEHSERAQVILEPSELARQARTALAEAATLSKTPAEPAERLRVARLSAAP